jgi:hypothetical protein
VDGILLLLWATDQGGISILGIQELLQDGHISLHFLRMETVSCYSIHVGAQGHH